MNHTVRRILLSIIGGLVVCSVIFFNRTPVPGSTPSYLKIADETISLDTVNTEESRKIGLSGRTGLDEGEGMLFVFEHPGTYSFWMKDMLFPIDIIWLDDHFKVVHIEHNLSPDTYPKSFTSISKALYVLEVSAGISQKHGVVNGTVLEPIFSE